MKAWQILFYSALIGVPLSDWIEKKRIEWAEWKREAWGIDE